MPENAVKFDAAVIGAGPAGMFAAMEIIERAPQARVVVFERGPVRAAGDRANATSGWGGAGAFSDGKLDLSSCVGGTVGQCVGETRFGELMAYVDGRYIAFGGKPDLVEAKSDPVRWEKVQSLRTRALSSNLDLAYFPIRHLGTDTAYTIVENIRKHLLGKGVVIRVDSPISEIVRVGASGYILRGEDGQETSAQHVVVAPGRFGAEWFAGQARKLGLKLRNNGIDVGVRVEVRSDTLRQITDLLYEAKLYFESRNGDRVRTFCMCPDGFVAQEDYRGLKTVNGHSYKGKKSLNTNFAVLMTQTFTEPFDDPLGYGKYISGLANKLAGGGVLVQRLGDLRDGRRSKQEKLKSWLVQPTLTAPEAVPGDLALAVPHRHLQGIVEMLDAMETIAPGIASKHTLLYGIEVKFYSYKIDADEETFETASPGLYVAGDGAGYTRGLLQASMNGVLAGRAIASRI